MVQRKAGGYVFRMYDNDHPPLHVHVFLDGREVAKYDLENGGFLDLANPRHAGRIRRALARAGFIER